MTTALNLTPQDRTWDEWTDSLGQVFRPGDLISIATISGRSPQLVIAQVIKINRVDSSGSPIQTHHTRYGKNSDGSRNYKDRKDYTRDSCSVKAQPLFRGWGGFIDNPESERAVTYKILHSILKVPYTREELNDVVAAKNQHR